MKLLTIIASIVAAASAGQIYTNQPAENYAKSAEVYQSAIEYQQQGVYSDQSQAYPTHNAAHQSRPLGEKHAKILGYLSENDGHNYRFSYETENGIKAQEVRQISDKSTEAHGAYSYTGDDGQVYTVSYVADENGFRAQGNHLPTSPPIPEAIVRSLEQNAQDEASGIHDDGKYRQQHQPTGQTYQQYEQVHQHDAGYHATAGQIAVSANNAYHTHQ